jgi:hypothetical protein
MCNNSKVKYWVKSTTINNCGDYKRKAFAKLLEVNLSLTIIQIKRKIHIIAFPTAKLDSISINFPGYRVAAVRNFIWNDMLWNRKIALITFYAMI